MYVESRRNHHEFQMMMLKMMSSLQPSLLTSLLPGPMAVPQLMLSNIPMWSNANGESGPTQPTFLAVDPLCNTIDWSITEVVDAAVLKPNVPTTSMETDHRDSVDGDLKFEVGHQTIELKWNIILTMMLLQVLPNGYSLQFCIIN